VVIRNYHIDAEFVGRCHRLMAVGTAVGRYDQIKLIGTGIMRNMPWLDTVAFSDTVGDVISNIGADITQKIQQNDGGRNAVDIIVSEYQNFLIAGDGIIDPLDCRRYAF